MTAEDIVVLVIALLVVVVCVIGAVTGLTPAEMIEAITPTRRRYWLRRYVDRELAGLTREPTRADIESAVVRFDIDPRGRIHTMKVEDRRRKLTEELLPTSARIAELEDELDPKPTPRPSARSSRPWEVYPDGWRFR